VTNLAGFQIRGQRVTLIKSLQIFLGDFSLSQNVHSPFTVEMKNQRRDKFIWIIAAERQSKIERNEKKNCSPIHAHTGSLIQFYAETKM
jgi:hypothetical protein